MKEFSDSGVINMLWGEKSFLEGLKDDILNVEKQQGFKIIFGSTIGSISRGMNR